MYDRILQAAVRVLGDEGALGFTTTRVADEAGISVGSLYQYFPNKHAIVSALHDADMRAGWAHIESILDQPTWSARRKLRELAEWFFVKEAEEAASYGAVTGDIDVFLHDSGTGIDAELAAKAFTRFCELLEPAGTAGSAEPHPTNARDLEFTAEFVMVTLESVGKGAAAHPRPRKQTIAWAQRTADMLSNDIGLP